VGWDASTIPFPKIPAEDAAHHITFFTTFAYLNAEVLPLGYHHPVMIVGQFVAIAVLQS